MANTWTRLRPPRTWPEQLREARASLRRLLLFERDPVERDPLASLVDTARRLDYGAGRFHGTEAARHGRTDLTDPRDLPRLSDFRDFRDFSDLRDR
ncbi:hypothetical protein ABT063_19280 [Streptomyces sp. NPDC002838]|uniref:hypothetical protein n=1 Tax=Streptomyces sp. NPDC002838 TaxID=3154436 RepID=UPI00331A6A7C